MRFNCLIYYNKLAQSDENNHFVSNYLQQACKIISDEIKEKYNDKFDLNIDYLYMDKGEEGLKQLFSKIDTYNNNDLFFTQAHVITKYQLKVLNYLSNKNYIFFHHSPSKTLKNEIDKDMFCLAKTGGGINLALLHDEIQSYKDKNVYYLHNGIRNADTIIEKYKNDTNFSEFLFEGATESISDTQKLYIKSRTKEILSKIKADEIIIMDVGLKYIKEIFTYLEENSFKNKVISLFGSVEGRFKKISFDFIKIGGYNLVSSLSNLDLVNKIYPEGLSDSKRRLADDSTYRLEIPLLIAESLNKCSDNDLKNKNKDAIKSSIISFDGETDIFLGKRNDYAFDKQGNNILRENLAFIYPNSLQTKDYMTPKILYKKQYNAQLEKFSVIYSYIDIERVTNISIQTGTWSAEFFIDIISDLEDPINEIIFNNLSASNDKFTYKLIFEKQESDKYSTKRYHVVANFDFLPLADNFPFDWQHIYISQTIKNSKKYMLQPIPQELVDKDFDIAEWKLLDSLAGVKYKKNRLYKGTNLVRTVEISKENRVGWILKRKNTATLLKIGVPLFFLIFLVYYSTFIDFDVANRSISILTTTFLSAIALYFSVEKPVPKTVTIVDVVFIWFYLVNGITIVTYGFTSFIGQSVFYSAALALQIVIPFSFIYLAYYLSKRIKRNRESILLDRDI